MNNLVIFGGGGVGKFVAHAINEINKKVYTWNILGYIDDDDQIDETNLNGYPLLGNISWLRENPVVTVAVAIAEPTVKVQVIEKIIEYGCEKFATIIHPHTWIAESVKVGKGSIIYPGTTINVNTEIGRFAIVNMNCSIGHDVEINDYTFLAPNVGIGGNTHVSKGCVIGIGASLKQSLMIGEWAVVGAGSVVIRDVEQGQTVAGVPAKPLQSEKLKK